MVKYYGELSYWEDDEQSTEIGMWEQSPTVYTKRYSYDDMRFNFSDMTSNAISQWNDALGFSMEKTSDENASDIQVYGGSISELKENDVWTLTPGVYGVTDPNDREFIGYYSNNGNLVKLYRMNSAKIAIVRCDRMLEKYKKTTVHEFGHALGFLGHITEREVGVMRQGDFADYELTTYDIRHLRQLY